MPRCRGEPRNRDRRRFIAGVMEGFFDRLAAEKRNNTAKGLVCELRVWTVRPSASMVIGIERVCSVGL